MQEQYIHDGIGRTPSYRRGDDGLAPPFSKRSFAARAERRPDLSIDTSAALEQEDSQYAGTGTMSGPTSVAPSKGYQDVAIPRHSSKVSRKSSVADRSPLQKLEVTLGDLSKEEKRARAQEAEQIARRKSARTSQAYSTNSSQLRTAIYDEPSAYTTQSPSTANPRPRVVSELARRPNETQNRTQQSQQRRVRSDGSNPAAALSSSITSPRFGYDSARTGGPAAAAVGAFQLARRRGSGPWGPESERTLWADVDGFQNPALSREALSTGYSSNNTFKQPTGLSQDSHTAVADDSKPSYGGASSQKSLTAPAATTTANSADQAVNYQISQPGAEDATPPQSDSGEQIRKQVGFSPDTIDSSSTSRRTRPDSLIQVLTPWHGKERRYQKGPTLDEWKSGETAVLSGGYLDLEPQLTKNTTPWWEREETAKRAGSRKQGVNVPTQSSHGTATKPSGFGFNPPLKLKCGPLLRYTGIKSVGSAQSRKEIWRGSVMIVTDDKTTPYTQPPVLRLFKQPPRSSNTLQPQSNGNTEGSEAKWHELDLLTGQIKCSQTGQPLRPKPAHSLPAATHLSDDGLFEPVPQTAEGDSGGSQASDVDGEILGKFREVKGHRLHTERGFTFWRFNIEVELGADQARIAYRINQGPAIGFWVPGRGEPMNIMFHSCNGFSASVNPHDFSGPDPMWRDVLNAHQHNPFHVMLGGGDQIYNDGLSKQTSHFKTWLSIKNPEHKLGTIFSGDMQREVELFYFQNYSKWFSQGFFGMANSQIPMVNIWDDHDILDGFGSYPHKFMRCPVFSGVGNVAFKYYMLFQHHSVPDETQMEEPSWILGEEPGPYINERSRSLFLSLGKHVSFLGVDCRTERMDDEILSQETYDNIFDRAREEIIEGETTHLIVLLGVPIAYPRLNFLENILTSRLMDPLKAMGRKGMLGGFVNSFDGGIEILDDLDDHWTARHHKHERNWFIQELQELAAEKSVRITILGGDVHLAAVGQFFTNKKLHVPKDHDHRYMPNVVSSAIVNTPPPNSLADIINRRNKIHHLDEYTDESMIPLFTHDVTGKSRNNRNLLPRRNWCSIREYDGSVTPPPSPSLDGGDVTGSGQSKRSFSLIRRSSSRSSSMSRSDSGKGSLFRRLSSRRGREGAPPSSFRPNEGEEEQPPASSQSAQNLGTQGDFSLPERPHSHAFVGQDERPSFQRRPSHVTPRMLSRDATGRRGMINLEGGLEVTLHCEVNQKDPRGETVPYRLIVPALFYKRQQLHEEPPPGGNKLTSLFGSLRRGRSQQHRHASHEDGQHLGTGTAATAAGIAATSPLANAGVNGKTPSDREIDEDPSFDHEFVSASGPANTALPSALDTTAMNNRQLDDKYTDQVAAGQAQIRNMPRGAEVETELPAHLQSEGRRSYERSRSQPRSSMSVQRYSNNSDSHGGRPASSSSRRSGETHKNYSERPVSGTLGPPPPQNIHQLPASVQKRYSSWSDRKSAAEPLSATSPSTRHVSEEMSDLSPETTREADLGTVSPGSPGPPLVQPSPQRVHNLDHFHDENRLNDPATRDAIATPNLDHVTSDPKLGETAGFDAGNAAAFFQPGGRNAAAAGNENASSNLTQPEKPKRSISNRLRKKFAPRTQKVPEDSAIAKKDISGPVHLTQPHGQPLVNSLFDNVEVAAQPKKEPSRPSSYHAPGVKIRHPPHVHGASRTAAADQSPMHDQTISDSPSPPLDLAPQRGGSRQSKLATHYDAPNRGNVPVPPSQRAGNVFPYRGPISSRYGDSSYFQAESSGLPLPRPIGLGMSDKAARQLGYDEGFPGEDDGSWLRHQTMNRSVSAGAASQRPAQSANSRQPQPSPRQGHVFPGPEGYEQAPNRTIIGPYGHAEGFDDVQPRKSGGGGGLIRRLSDSARTRLERLDQWATSDGGVSPHSTAPRSSWKPWKRGDDVD